VEEGEGRALERKAKAVAGEVEWLGLPFSAKW
jgi:hypothetical protein